MSEEKIPTNQELISPGKLHQELGVALEDGDIESALALVKRLQVELERGRPDTRLDSDHDTDSQEHLFSTEVIVQKLFELPDVEITIFGTGRGLTAPFSCTTNGLDNQGTPTYEINDKGLNTSTYERGNSGQDVIKEGVRFFRTNGERTAELVKKSRDAFGRKGFKGIQIIFPESGAELAQAVDEQALIYIWQMLKDKLPQGSDREYFTYE